MKLKAMLQETEVYQSINVQSKGNLRIDKYENIRKPVANEGVKLSSKILQQQYPQDLL